MVLREPTYFFLQLIPEFFLHLDKKELQQSLLQTLVDILLETKLSEVTALIKKRVAEVSYHLSHLPSCQYSLSYCNAKGHTF